jgi:hypothetical protein
MAVAAEVVWVGECARVRAVTVLGKGRSVQVAHGLMLGSRKRMQAGSRRGSVGL